VSDSQSDVHSTVASYDTQLSVETAFPDTSIDLQYIKGQTFQLQRGISTMNSASVASSNQVVPEDDLDDNIEEDELPVVNDEQV
jgi:hypothetical protein